MQLFHNNSRELESHECRSYHWEFNLSLHMWKFNLSHMPNPLDMNKIK